MLVAQPPDSGQIALGGREDAPRSLYRFGDHRRHPLSVLGEHGGHRLDVVVGHLHEMGHQVAPALAVQCDALGDVPPKLVPW